MMSDKISESFTRILTAPLLASVVYGVTNSIIRGSKMGLFDEKQSIVRELISTIDSVAEHYEEQIIGLKDKLSIKEEELRLSEDRMSEQLEINANLNEELFELKKKKSFATKLKEEKTK